MKNGNRIAWLSSFLLTVYLFLSAPVALQAAPGDLDPSFGQYGGGITTAPQGRAHAVAIQADGSIVVAGQIKHDDNDFVLARYNADGTLSFWVSTGFGGDDKARAITIQPDGKIVIVGSTNSNLPWPKFNLRLAMARYNTDGTLDETFGVGGKVITEDLGTNDAAFFPQGDIANALVIQADGKIVVAGVSGFDFAVARYNSNGTLDTTFGNGGKVITNFCSIDEASAIALQADGKIVVAGFICYVTTPVSGQEFVLLRYNTDGTLDETFGVGGTVITNVPGLGERINALAIQADGNIVVAGASSYESRCEYYPCPPIPRNFALARYNSNGTLDNSFGSSGIVITDFPNSPEEAFGLALQADGKIVAAGYVTSVFKSCPICSDERGTNFAIARYTDTGILDTSFGVGGKVISLGGGLSAAHAVALQADGRIVAAGYAKFFCCPTSFAVARYLGDSPAAYAGPDQSVKEGTLVTLNGSGSSDPKGNPLTFSWTQVGGTPVTLSDPTAVMPTFTTPEVDAYTVLTFQLIVNNGQINTTPDTVRINVRNNQAPIANAGPDQTVEATSPTGASVTLNGSASFDPDGDPLSYTWTGSFGVVSGVSPTVSLPLGTHTVTLTVSDGQATATDTVYITVLNRPPDVSQAKPSLATLWPPNHKFVPVSIIGITDPDSDPVTITITKIFQDEPVLGEGSGKTSPDATGIGTSVANLRAERSGKGNGRVYTITFEASDGKGGITPGTVKVGVPHDQGKGKTAFDDGSLFDSTQ